MGETWCTPGTASYPGRGPPAAPAEVASPPSGRASPRQDGTRPGRCRPAATAPSAHFLSGPRRRPRAAVLPRRGGGGEPRWDDDPTPGAASRRAAGRGAGGARVSGGRGGVAGVPAANGGPRVVPGRPMGADRVGAAGSCC